MCLNAIVFIMVVVSTCFYATCAYMKAFIHDMKIEMAQLNSYLDNKLLSDARYLLEIKKIIVDIIEFHVIIYE